MATQAVRLAAALESLKLLQDKGIVGIKHSDLKKSEKALLKKQGFILEAVRGWYIAVSPNENTGESTSWYASFWKFLVRFLNERYGDNYCLSAEQSLRLHTGIDSIPHQIIVRSPKGTNTPTSLIFGTSLYAMRSPMPEVVETELNKGLRIMSLPHAIIHYPPSLFNIASIEIITALLMIKDSSELLSVLLEGGHSTIAGRLAGAYRNMGLSKIADDILKTMTAVDYNVRENTPFTLAPPILLDIREHSPYINRIRLMWSNMRDTVIDVFSSHPEISTNKEAYLQQIEELYISDAYHSLSIERYSVTPELIEKVRSGKRDTAENRTDQQQKDAMAARGYWQAFTAVKNSITKVLDGENAGKITANEHSDWYREMFSPSVMAGLIRPSDLAGYRNNQVYIANSKHTPLHDKAVLDTMPLLFELLENETKACVRAVLGHFIFVYIHPYMDGNGRMARFLMNVMLASGGYPWTIIPLEQRSAYMQALETASVEHDIKPFALFIAQLIKT